MYGAMPKTPEKPMSQCPPGFASDKMDYKQYSKDDQKIIMVGVTDSKSLRNPGLEGEDSDKTDAFVLIFCYVSFFSSLSTMQMSHSYIIDTLFQ